MEVTSVVKQSVILIFLYLSNTWGYTHSSLGSVSYRSPDNSHLQTSVAGIPHGSLVLQSVPSVYSDPPAAAHSYQQLSLPAYSANTGYAYEAAPAPLSESSLPRLVFSLVRNAGQFVLALLDLTDVDRHSSLRGVADNINSILDSLEQLEERATEIFNNVSQRLQTIPIVGIFVRLFLRFFYLVTYIPDRVMTTVQGALKNLFSTNPKTAYAINNMRYAYV